jgi:hypothetical protein
MKKKCTGCDDIQTISNFHKNKSKKDGLSSYCKLCSKNYAAYYYDTNKHSLSIYYKERYQLTK